MFSRNARLLLGISLMLPFAAAMAQDTATAPAEGKPLDEALIEFRESLQDVETEIISKNVSLTAEEATAFWPVFQRFQSERRPIIDGQIEAVRDYAKDFATLTPEDSRAYVEALLERDQRIHDLRVKYLAEFAKVLPANKAARVIHISRRLGLASQAKLANEIPLVR